MNFNDFKAGTYKQQYQYKSFSPKKINMTWTYLAHANSIYSIISTKK